MLAQKMTTDHQLIEAFQAGDDAAFAQLYEKYNAPVTTYVARMLGSIQDAEDITTEAFVKVAQGHYRPTGSFKSFLFTTVRRMAIDRIRTHKRRTKLLRWFRAEPQQATPEDVVGQIWETAEVAAAVASLGDDHRQVVLLFYTHELTTPEIAEIIGSSDQTVRSRLSYARKKLRQSLEASDAR